ncbi:MAG: hypothetical protein PVH61_11995 [Candidatus Aminicenantes bacterium]|jgi:hypothetical protein
MKRKILMVFIMLGLVGVTQVNSRTQIGIFGTLSSKHDYFVYFQEGKETAEKPGTDFKEKDLFVSILFKRNTELNVFVRKFKAENTFIEGGTWNTSKYLVGFSIGKALTLKLGIPDGHYSFYAFPIDFSVGPYLIGSLKNQYTYVSGSKNDNVITDNIRFSYGIYTTIRLRLEFLREKYKFPMVTVGVKYFIPFNNFEYSIDPNASYRLQRKMFFIGVYF